MFVFLFFGIYWVLNSGLHIARPALSTWATPPAIFALFVFLVVSYDFAQADPDHDPYSWDYRYVPPYLVY
jgi:hypothetical protein